jgi:hypothetical protein
MIVHAWKSQFLTNAKPLSHDMSKTNACLCQIEQIKQRLNATTTVSRAFPAIALIRVTTATPESAPLVHVQPMSSRLPTLTVTATKRFFWLTQEQVVAESLLPPLPRLLGRRHDRSGSMANDFVWR